MDEIAAGVWVARHEYLDVNVGVVAGARGLLVVDTLWSERAARELARRLPGEVVAVVNTHDHWDHVLGNAVFGGSGTPVHAHEDAARAMDQLHPAQPDSPYADEIAASTVRHPDRTFSSVTTVDLGDRLVELLHPGRGHTAGDLLVRVADADVLFAGDLVEQSGPPSLGPDSYPLEWPAALDLMAELCGSGTVVVPGHGSPVNGDFVAAQRAELGVVAETIRDLASRGVPVTEALRSAEWPYDVRHLGHAVRRGYEHLPRSARSLPLL